jgi:hypothetical protein
LPEILPETLGQDSRDEIDRAARRKSDDDPDGSAALAERGASVYGETGDEDGKKFSQHALAV